MSDSKTPRIKLGGLWQHTTKTGVTFLSGDFTFGSQIQVWPNKKRDGKNDPDFTVYLSEKVKKDRAVEVNMDAMNDLPRNDVEIPF